MKQCNRMLISDTEVEHFVDNILCTDPNSKRQTVNSIAAAERNIRGYNIVPTLTHTCYRDYEYRDDKKREELRLQIVQELIIQQRLDDDNLIILGKGGAAPKTEIKAEKKLYYVIGPPASGKSSVSNNIADAVCGYIVDSDFAKRKLPEYSNQIGGASLVHDESNELVFSLNRESLLKHCIKNGFNMVLPKIGHNLDGIRNFCEVMKDLGYKVYLISIDVDRFVATRRACERFLSDKRYVPLSLIFDVYSNESTLNYFRLKQTHNDLFDGFAQISAENFPVVIKEQIDMNFLCDLFRGC